MYRTIGRTLLAAAAIATGAVAYAAGDTGANDALSIGNAKIPLASAIAAAEQHVNGKAARASYRKSGQAWVYDVEVASGAKVFDVKVDPHNGTVLSSTEDKADTDDDGDED